MNIPAADSVLDIANWFFKKSEKDCWYLDDCKVQHLLFLAQLHYALEHDRRYLAPACFIADENGFSEPTLGHFLDFGRPLMASPRLDEKITLFLEKIWKKYALLNLSELTEIIKSSRGYKDNYVVGNKNIVDILSLIADFSANAGIIKSTDVSQSNAKKILLSQNGPVVVSKWQPRKLSATKKDK